MRILSAGAAVVSGLLACIAAAPGGGETGSQAEQIVFTRIPAGRAPSARPTRDGMLRSRYGDGGRVVLLSADGSTHTLTAGFESAADPSISFDGKRILFAGKKAASDRWNIYEMNSDGSGIRQITRDLGNCRSPIYQPSIFYLDDPGPMPQIAFVSEAPGELGEYGAAPATAIYSARLDGSGVRRLTYNPSGAFDPVMLPDGRMLFSGWQRDNLSRGVRGSIELLATNIDGTDYAAFSGNQGSRFKQMACVTAKRLVVFVDANAAAWDGAGPLGVIDLRRNLHSYRRLPVPAAYLYHSPSPLPDGSVLVSRRPGNSGGTLGIFHLDPETGRMTPVFDAPDTHDVQAQALAPRAMPDGRSSVVDESQAWAKLYCLNVYETSLDAKLWPKGSVKRIRLLEGLPRPVADAAAPDSLSPLLHKRLLGVFDVNEDGSFHTKVPANLPVQIQALDADGMAFQSSAWIWAKNKEQRGCIGCHEDGERTPENVMASALTQPAVDLTLPRERRRTVEFDRDVAPIFARRCATAACHGGAARPKLCGAGGRFGAAYEALLAKAPGTGGFLYVTPGAARTSPLTWAIFGRNTAKPWDHVAPGVAVKKMPPAGAPALTAREREAIIEWIDMGAHYNGLPGGGEGGQR